MLEVAHVAHSAIRPDRVIVLALAPELRKARAALLPLFA